MSSQSSIAVPGLFAGSAAKSDAATVQSAPNPGEAWGAIAWLGAALAFIGWTDVMIGLFPFNVGNPDWEFGGMSAAFDSMPLGTIGLGIALAAALARGRRKTITAIAVLTTLIVLFIAGAMGMFALAVPVVLNSVPQQVRIQVLIPITKTTLLAMTYFVLYIILSRAAWRGARARSGRK